MRDVIVVGSANVDLVTNAPRMVNPGETLMGTRFEQLFGGKGANQAVAAALLGSSVHMVAKVGADSLGAASLTNFGTLGVSTANVTSTTEAATGVAQITVDATGQNEIIIVPGANSFLSAADVEAAAPSFAASKVLLTQLEVPLATTMAALRAGRAAGLITVFNSAPAPTEELPEELFPLCDVICPNESEAALLTGLPTESIEQCEAAAAALLCKGAKAVCLTLGSRGCMLCQAGVPMIHVQVPPHLKAAKVVDTTGAGDAFLGALAHLVASGKPLVDALQGAVHVASISVQRRGAQTSYPQAAELPKGLLAPVEAAAAASPTPPVAVAGQEGPCAVSPKRAAAIAAVDEHVKSGSVVGVGTGSTVSYMLARMAERLRSGALADISVVPTSKKTESELSDLGIPCLPSDSNAPLNVALGGADAVDANGHVIKGGKGALLREKLVQASASRYVVVVDEEKLTERLGASYPIPVEITPIYSQRTLRRIVALPTLSGCNARLRYGLAPAGLPGCAIPGDDASLFVTDNGNLIVDLFLNAPLESVAETAAELSRTPGVLEHGLFTKCSSTSIIVGHKDGHMARF